MYDAFNGDKIGDIKIWNNNLTLGNSILVGQRLGTCYCSHGHMLNRVMRSRGWEVVVSGFLAFVGTIGESL